METADREDKVPMLWYWSEPENGMDMETCEMIAKESTFIPRKDRLVNMYIAFV